MKRASDAKATAIFYCNSCKRPKALKQMSDKTFLDKPMCKRCAKGRGESVVDAFMRDTSFFGMRLL